MVHGNLLINCPITIKYITAAENIFGPKFYLIKDKTMIKLSNTVKMD